MVSLKDPADNLDRPLGASPLFMSKDIIPGTQDFLTGSSY